VWRSLRVEFGLSALLIAVAVFAFFLILVGIFTISNAIGHWRDEGKIKEARAELEELKTALYRYREDNGRVPTTNEGLSVLCRPTSAGILRGPYVPGPYLRFVPNDPWGNPYLYKSDGDRYVIESLGAHPTVRGEATLQPQADSHFSTIRY